MSEIGRRQALLQAKLDAITVNDAHLLLPPEETGAILLSEFDSPPRAKHMMTDNKPAHHGYQERNHNLNAEAEADHIAAYENNATKPFTTYEQFAVRLHRDVRSFSKMCVLSVTLCASSLGDLQAVGFARCS